MFNIPIETLPFLKLYPIRGHSNRFLKRSARFRHIGRANCCNGKKKKLHASIASFIAWYWQTDSDRYLVIGNADDTAAGTRQDNFNSDLNANNFPEIYK